MALPDYLSVDPDPLLEGKLKNWSILNAHLKDGNISKEELIQLLNLELKKSKPRVLIVDRLHSRIYRILREEEILDISKWIEENTDLEKVDKILKGVHPCLNNLG